MKQRRRVAWSGRRVSRPAWWLVVVMTIGMAGGGTAHDLFTAYVQHHVRLTLGARHVDVVLELTFFEEWSSRERARMDANGNGRISRAELEAYGKKLVSDLENQVGLVIGGQAVALAPLYEPEVDLLASDKVGSDHHRVRLTFFAPTPVGLRAGDDVVVEDRLWLQAKALGTVEAEGRDSGVMTAEKLKDPGFPAGRPGEARLFKAKCVKPPELKSAIR